MAELRFACDRMLGGVARWLRFAGLDVTFDPALPGVALAGQAREQGRWLLTADRHLAARAGPRVVLLPGAGIESQLGELRRRLPLAAPPAGFLTRCSHCNAVLAPVTREEAAPRVPPYVAAHAERFLACPACRRVYWPGTHTTGITRRLAAWLGS